MKAVLTGTDFVKDIDGSYKALEINTNIALQLDASRYIDSTAFDTFIKDNGFNEIHLIYTNKNTQIKSDSDVQELEPEASFGDADLPYSPDFVEYLNKYCSGSNLIFTRSQLENNAVTVPFIEDSENKLILRIAYDTTALIDDTYSRDNWEFLKLMNDSDPNSIPKTYISDAELGFDSIGTTLRDNGLHPNYCVKKRITPADNNVYPKFFKLNTLEELENLKIGLQSDEYIQEYILNLDDTVEGKLSHYRSVDIVYGSNLDIHNLMIVQATNISDICPDPVYDNNQIVIWDTPMYKNKYNSALNLVGIKLSADESTKVLDTNNQIILAKDLIVGDAVKSISLEATEPAYKWSGPLNDILLNTTEKTTTLKTKESINYFGSIISLELDNGLIFSDVPHALILSTEEIDGISMAVFKDYQNLQIGELVVIWDNQLNKLDTKTITNITYAFDSLSAYVLDFETFDTFLTLSENGDTRYGLITHNFNYDCYLYSCPSGYYVPSYAFRCAGGGVPSCYYRTVCVKVSHGWGPYPNVNLGPGGVFGNSLCNTNWGGCGTGVTAYISGAGWCNWAK